MDLKQQYPRSSCFNQLKNPLNINSLIFSRHANCLMNLRNCSMKMTLSSSNFFSPYDDHQTAQISFIWRAVLRRYIATFKNCVTREKGGGGTPYNPLHKEAPLERGTIFGLQA